MVLSSNWINLQKSKKVKVSKISKKNKINVAAQSSKDGTSKILEKKTTKSKIMSMVYHINSEINRAKEAKAQGVEIKFKNDEDNKILNEKLMESRNLSKSVAVEQKQKDIGRYVAMDCEFVGVGPEGADSALARVSIVNFYGHVIIDEFVKPQELVTDWRTWVSGIKPEHMKNAVTFHEAQKRVAKILDKRILVGHAVKHDLEALLISHPKSMIRDTARHLPYREKYAKGKSPSLKKLAEEVFQIKIQDGQHSSVEDAKMTMLLYKNDKAEFEKLHKNFPPNN